MKSPADSAVSRRFFNGRSNEAGSVGIACFSQIAFAQKSSVGRDSEDGIAESNAEEGGRTLVRPRMEVQASVLGLREGGANEVLPAGTAVEAAGES